MKQVDRTNALLPNEAFDSAELRACSNFQRKWSINEQLYWTRLSTVRYRLRRFKQFVTK